jgi:hypothetical protein
MTDTSTIRDAQRAAYTKAVELAVATLAEKGERGASDLLVKIDWQAEAMKAFPDAVLTPRYADFYGHSYTWADGKPWIQVAHGLTEARVIASKEFETFLADLRSNPVVDQDGTPQPVAIDNLRI